MVVDQPTLRVRWATDCETNIDVGQLRKRILAMSLTLWKTHVIADIVKLV